MKQVACVCLTRDRDVMLRQAVDSFLAQTYENKMLFILDTGDGAVSRRLEDTYPNHIRRWWCRDWYGVRGDAKTIGELRNLANTYAVTNTSKDVVIAHWDSDDWSHPSRIAEQVGLLESTGADVVGYNEVVFWRDPGACDCNPGPCVGERCGLRGEAHHYRDVRKTYAIGSSLCYWTKAWQARPFQKAPIKPNATGEDWLFISGLNCRGVSAMATEFVGAPGYLQRFSRDNVNGAACQLHEAHQVVPRMICRIHGGNTADYSNVGSARPGSFARAPQFDDLCRRVFSR